jgi:hypothetical protein
VDRALPRPLNLPPLWVTGLVFASMLIALETAVVMALMPEIRNGAIDWDSFVLAGQEITAGRSPYGIEGFPFRWNPLAAYGFALLAPVGLLGWSLLHFAVLGLLRDWRLIALAVTSWPFWFDLDLGNALTFVAVAGVLALRGSMVASVGYFALCALMPRPLMLPLMVWLLWKQPRTRVPFVATMAVMGAATLATGWADEWLATLLSSTEQIDHFWNWGPSRLVGAWWLVVGIPLGVWLTYRGKVGWAGLVISPYVLPYYGLLLLASTPPTYRTPPSRPRTSSPTSPAPGP